MAKSKGRRLAEWLRNLDSNSKASSNTLADDSVTAAKIADDAVTNAAIADGAVHTANIADTGVTFAKLHTALVVTESDAIGGSNDNDTTIATSAAIKDYVDTQVAGKDNTDEITEGSTNLYFTNERVDDRVSSLLTAGTGITLTYDDAANTLTVAGSAQYGDSDARSALSVTTNSAGTAALAYNSSTGVFTYTPPDLSSYLTSYTESDTLDSVTGRGATTTNNITVGNATVTGNLTVQGTTTTLETATLNVEDKNITLNYSTGDSSGSANGAGITIQDAVNSTTDATILWNTTTDQFDFSHGITVENDSAILGKLSIEDTQYDNHLELVRSSEQWRLSPSTNGSLDIRRVAGTGTARVDIQGHLNTRLNDFVGIGLGETDPSYDLHIKASTPQIFLQPTADAQSNRIHFSTAAGTGGSSIYGGGTYGDEMRFNGGSFSFFGDLSAEGTISLSAASGAELRVKDTTNNAEVVVLAQDSDGWIGTKSNHILKFGTNYGGKVAIDTTGNLYPLTDSSRTLGTNSLRWSELFVDEITATGTMYAAGNAYYTASTNNRVKYALWGDGDTTYGMGMRSAFTYGHLTDYAVCFQMSNTTGRGFWWGDSSHSQSQGAMSLTTQGHLTVATTLSVGQGESVTSPSQETLYVGGTSTFTGKITHGHEFRLDNGSGGTTHLNYEDNGANYIRGTTTYIDTALELNGATQLDAVMKINEGSNGNIIYEYNGNGGFIPLLAQNINSGSTQTGAIKIDFNISGRADMIQGWIDIFNYTANDTISIHIGGYLYQGAGQNEWVNESVTILANNSTQNWTVRFGHDGTNNCIWIGELNTTWNYSQIAARDWTVGYTADVDQYDLEPEISFESSSFAYVDATKSNNFPIAQQVVVNGNNDAAWYPVTCTADDYTILRSTYSEPVRIYPSAGYLIAHYLRMSHANQQRDTDTIFYSSTDEYIRKNTKTGMQNSLGIGGGAAYVDVATGNYGTIKVDDDRSVSWAGYAIRDDWVLMSNGATNLGIYDDTDNVWQTRWYRGGATELYWDGTAKAATTSTGFAITGDLTTSGNISPTGIFITKGNASAFTSANDTTLSVRSSATSTPAVMSFHRPSAYAINLGLDTDNHFKLGGWSASTVKHTWQNNGTYLATGDIYAYYSDERLKTKHGKIENAIEKVNSIETFYYTHNEKAKELGFEDDERMHVGVSAQTVEKVMPEVVALAPVDNNGSGVSISGENYKTVQYEKLVPLLIEAIKELKAEIEELKK